MTSRLTPGSYGLLAVQSLATVGALIDVRLEDSVELVPSLAVVLGALALLSYGFAIAAGAVVVMRDSVRHGVAVLLGATFLGPTVLVVAEFL